MPRVATYLPSTTSSSVAGSVNSSSAVPSRRSSDHTDMVRAGMNSSRMNGKTWLS